MLLIDLLDTADKESLIICDYFVAYFKHNNTCECIYPDERAFKKLLFKEVESINGNGSCIQINILED